MAIVHVFYHGVASAGSGIGGLAIAALVPALTVYGLYLEGYKATNPEGYKTMVEEAANTGNAIYRERLMKYYRTGDDFPTTSSDPSVRQLARACAIHAGLVAIEPGVPPIYHRFGPQHDAKFMECIRGEGENNPTYGVEPHNMPSKYKF